MSFAFRQTFRSLYAARRCLSYAMIVRNISLERQGRHFSNPLLKRSIRWMASGTHDVVKDLTISDVIREGKNGVPIIDVREQVEIHNTGLIPGSVNIPLGHLDEALKLSPDEFHRRYSMKKPEKNDKLIMSCQSGNRSKRAALALQQMGYNNVYNNSGGWKAYEELIKG